MITSRLNKQGLSLFLILMTVILTTILLPGRLLADDSRPGQNVEVLEKGQTISGPGFFAGNQVQVDGTIDGTTFATGQVVRVSGLINGDLFVAAQTILINGTVNGNIYGAGQNLKIATQGTGDVFTAGQTIDIAKEAVIGRDLFAAGQRISLDGTVKRQFFGGGSDVVISGAIGQNVNVEAENLMLLDGASVNGDLSYKSPNQANLAPGAKIMGLTDWQRVEITPKQDKVDPASTIFSMMLSIASSLLIWLLIKIWRPDFWMDIAGSVEEQPLKTMGMGVLAFLLTPLLIILLMITVIGLPLGIILGLVYGITLYLSKIIVAVFMGSWLTNRFGWTEHHKGIWPVLLSLAALVLLIKVPILGFFVWLLVVFAGLGAVLSFKYRDNSVKQTEY